ncbi:MAG: DsbA family protein [Pseudomonadota bacterium]|nr:DsbA family protein [Pseudomonadota bacterium]
MQTGKGTIRIEIFSDILCVWAYFAQARLDQLKRDFGDRVDLHHRYISVYGDSGHRIGEDWREKGGHERLNRHLRRLSRHRDYVDLHPEVWLRSAPPSSEPAHLYIKAAQRLEEEGPLPNARSDAAAGRRISEAYAWRLRCAFFAAAEDVADVSVLRRVATDIGLPVDALQKLVDRGQAHAALQGDRDAEQEYRVSGSPTLVFNEGRQKLYGNVGYRIIEANIRELLRNAHHGEASWC